MSMSFMNYHTALGLGHIGDSTENQHAAAGVWLGDREERKKAFVHVRTVRIASRYLHHCDVSGHPATFMVARGAW